MRAVAPVTLIRVATARTCPVISSPARSRSRCMPDAASSSRNTSILLSSHVRLAVKPRTSRHVASLPSSRHRPRSNIRTAGGGNPAVLGPLSPLAVPLLLKPRDTGVLAAGRVHVDLWAATQLDDGAAASTVRRRLSALSSFYRYCAAHDLIGRVPTQGVARPAVDPDYTATVGLDRDQARALVAAADADAGAQALRTAAVVRLRVVRKGARKAKIPLTPATVAAMEAYLADTGRPEPGRGSGDS